MSIPVTVTIRFKISKKAILIIVLALASATGVVLERTGIGSVTVEESSGQAD